MLVPIVQPPIFPPVAFKLSDIIVPLILAPLAINPFAVKIPLEIVTFAVGDLYCLIPSVPK